MHQGNRWGRSLGGNALAARMCLLLADGRGFTSTVIDALQFARVNKAALGIDVVNLSLGHHRHIGQHGRAG